MKEPRLSFSDAAVSDILEQSDWYHERSGRALADRWETAVSLTVLRIAANPCSGAICRFATDDLQGIRRLAIKRFPRHLVFYLYENREILILRVNPRRS